MKIERWAKPLKFMGNVSVVIAVLTFLVTLSLVVSTYNFVHLRAAESTTNTQSAENKASIDAMQAQLADIQARLKVAEATPAPILLPRSSSSGDDPGNATADPSSTPQPTQQAPSQTLNPTPKPTPAPTHCAVNLLGVCI